MFPSLYVELYNASVAGDLEKVRELQQKVLSISSAVYNVGQYGSSYLKGVKCVLGLLGICSDILAEPFQHFLPREREIVRKSVEALDLGVNLKG